MSTTQIVNSRLEAISHIIAKNVLNVDLMQYSEERLMEEIQELKTKFLEKLKILEMGVDKSDYELKISHLRGIAASFPHFDPLNFVRYNQDVQSVDYDFENVVSELELSAMRGTCRNKGIVYHTLPVYDFLFSFRGKSMTVKNTTQPTVEKRFLDVVSSDFLTYQATTSYVRFLKHKDAWWAYRLLQLDETEKLRGNRSNVQQYIKTTNSTYSHMHSSNSTSTLGALCTGVDNKFVELATRKTIDDIYTYLEFLNGMCYWVASSNLSDCYSAMLAPNRSIQSVGELEQEVTFSDNNVPISTTPKGSFLYEAHLANSVVRDFVHDTYKTIVPMLREYYTDEKIDFEKSVRKFFFTKHCTITTAYRMASLGDRSATPLIVYKDTIAHCLAQPNFLEFMCKSLKMLKSVHELFGSDVLLEQLPPDTLKKACFARMPDNKMYVVNHNFALLNQLVQMQRMVYDAENYSFLNQKPYYFDLNALVAYSKHSNTSEGGDGEGDDFQNLIKDMVMCFLINITAVESVRQMLQTWIIIDNHARFHNFFPRGPQFLNVVMEDVQHLAGGTLGNIMNSSSSLHSNEFINITQALSNYLPKFPTRLDTGRALHDVLKSSAPTRGDSFYRTKEGMKMARMLETFNY